MQGMWDAAHVAGPAQQANCWLVLAVESMGFPNGRLFDLRRLAPLEVYFKDGTVTELCRGMHSDMACIIRHFPSKYFRESFVHPCESEIYFGISKIPRQKFAGNEVKKRGYQPL